MCLMPIQGTFASCTGLGCSCSVSATTVSFGSYLPAATLDSTGNISVTCTVLILGLNVAYEVRLSTGGSGSFANRNMLSSGHVLNYNLYTDAGRSSIFGDTTSGTSSITDSYNLALLSRTRDYTVYGRIPSGQNPFAGSYQDTIIVSVIY
jgi:spore coat protein U-like protein